jgi:PTS system galactitol-specific IIC component
MQPVIDFILNVVNGFIGWGPVILIAIIFTVLGLVFGAGVRKSFRSGITTSVGLSGIFLVVNVIVGSYVPALGALSERLGITRPVVDVGWSVAGFGWGWPGAVGVVLATVIVSIIMIVLKLTKCLWTDFWSLWHSQVMAALVWAVTGNILFGVIAAVIYNIVVMKLADYTAKENQEFHQVPNITIPCGYVSIFGSISKLLAPVLRSIPGIKDVDASPETIREKLGVFGEMPVLGALIGLIIGLAAGYQVQGVLTLALDTALMLLLLPRMVAVLMEGMTPVARQVSDWLTERFEGREIHVAVDCAVQLGHPAVMASAIIVMPLAILATAFLPGYSFLIIASLAGIPYMCGAIVAHTKGNVLHTVILALIYQLVFMWLASLPMISGAYTATAQNLGLLGDLVGAGQQITAPDPGGDFLTVILVAVANLFGG